MLNEKNFQNQNRKKKFFLFNEFFRYLRLTVRKYQIFQAIKSFQLPLNLAAYFVRLLWQQQKTKPYTRITVFIMAITTFLL